MGADGVDWVTAATALSDIGCVRLARTVDEATRVALAEAAPSTWSPLPEVEGRVRQGGMSCGLYLDNAAPAVQDFARAICDGVTAARPGRPPVPPFNEVRWGRTQNGTGFITAHRDPPGAGGVIAVVTLSGRARFRVWHGSVSSEWETDDGDLVLLRGYGWPHEDSQCPIHEVESPRSGERMTMTLRYNRGGPGADYFS